MGTIKTEEVFLRGILQLIRKTAYKAKRVKMGLTINGEHGRANDLLKQEM